MEKVARHTQQNLRFQPSELPVDLPIILDHRSGKCRSTLFEQASCVLGKPITVLLKTSKLNRQPGSIGQLDDDAFFDLWDQKRFCKRFSLDDDAFRNMGFGQFEQKLAPSIRNWRDPKRIQEYRTKIQDVLRLASQPRICPQCIDERTSMRLSWRSQWLFACTRHHVLLANLCPSCHLPIASQRRLSRVVVANQCDNHPFRGDRCTQNLTEITTTYLGRKHPAIKAQHLIEGLFNGHEMTQLGRKQRPIDALQLLRELVDYLALWQPISALAGMTLLSGELMDYRIETRATWYRQRQQNSEAESEFAERESIQLRSANPAVWASVMPTAIALASLPNAQYLEDKLFEHVCQFCDDRADEAEFVVSFLNRRLNRTQLPILNVVFSELLGRVRRQFKIFA